jgi:RND family efflux transporter MFP subunit
MSRFFMHLKKTATWPFKRFGRGKVIIALVILVILGFVFWPKGQAKDQIQYQSVKRGTIQSTVSASGILTGKDNANLRFKVGGKLSYVNVKVGDKVTKGDLLAGIDVQDLNLNLETAQNNLRTAQAALDKTLDDIHLFQYGNGGFGNVGSASETQTQKQTRVAAEMNLNNAKDSVASTQRAYQDAVIVSPLDGIITQSPFYPGQTVSAADAIVQVVNESEIYFDSDIDEADIAKISVNQPVDVTLNSYPDKTFKGYVAEILPVTKTTTSGATVVTTRINLQNPAVTFVNGLNGQASIITAQAQNTLTVPVDALRDDKTVLVKKSDGLHAVQVTTGLQSDTDVEITSGLNEGDEIVINPTVVKPNQIKK